MATMLRERVEKETAMMRDTYVRTITDLAQKDPRIVVLDADLMNAMAMVPFSKAFPQRTFNCGIQEANMIGLAAGMSATGKIPFAHSFGPFATRRCYDQIFISGAYARLNVRIIGSDPGITAAYNGGTHMPFEDMGILRTIPTVTLLEPVDSVMLESLMRQSIGMHGIVYFRLNRKIATAIYQAGAQFTIGKAVKLTTGPDATIIASGIMVAEALQAAASLATEGISVTVLNVFTWKPIDVQAIVEAARATGAVVTAENHNIINGLGSAVAEVLAEHCPVPMERVGVGDRFGEVGPEADLRIRFGLTSERIVEKVRAAMARKANR
jgi:transketolase